MTDAHRRSWRESLAPPLGALLVRLLGATWRVDVEGREHWGALRASETPFIFMLWHGELLPLLWYHRGQGVLLLVSEHRDGELIAQAALRLGYGLVRGSSSRGGARALLEVVSQLKRGKIVAITPDGPRGPRYSFAPGAAVAAQRSQAPLLAVRVTAERAWRLRSWDQFLIPKPFTRVRIAYGAPVHVEATDIAGAEAETARLGRALNEAGEAIGV